MSLYSLGANGMGQLGTGDSEDCSTPQKVQLPIEFQAPPLSIVGGGNHLLVLDSQNSLFGCGNSIALGYSSETAFTTRLEMICNSRVEKNFGCGFSHSALISNNINSFGENQFGQLGNFAIEGKSFQSENSSFKYISCGPRSTFAIKEDGTLWGWGTLRGVFKSGPKQNPHQLLGFSSVKKVQAGFYHLLVLTQDGSLYTLGLNRHGQRGVLDCQDSVPSLVKLGEKVIDIQTGWHHCLVLTESGNVWGWGRNDHFQLGLQGSCIKEPRQLPLHDIIQIAAGSEHNAALSHDGQVYVWGWNEHGNCGISPVSDSDGVSFQDVASPTRLLLPEQELPKFIGCGYGFTLIWCEPL